MLKLTVCSTMQLVDFFSSNLKAAPESLGDPQREAAEDIQERYERVVASSFLALAALLLLYRQGEAGLNLELNSNPPTGFPMPCPRQGARTRQSAAVRDNFHHQVPA